jgi:membrane protease YdiL (CAAX protease family)
MISFIALMLRGIAKAIKLAWFHFFWISVGPLSVSWLAVMIVVSQPYFPNFQVSEQGQLIFIASVAGAAAFFSIFVAFRPRAAFSGDTTVRSLPLAFGCGLMLLTVKWLLNLSAEIANTSSPISENIFSVLLICVIGPIVEEAFFRGVLWKEFRAMSISEPGVLGVTSLLFVMAHASLSLSTNIHLLFMGISLGFIRYFSGSIWLGILFHMAMNAIVLFSI